MAVNANVVPAKVVPANDWKLGCEEIKQRGAHLLESGQLSDCTFLVGPKPNQASVAGHKFIFGMASPVFEAMFYGSMAEHTDSVITILDIEPDAFNDLVVYLYTDKIKIASFDKACDLYYAAKKYLMSHLKEQCLKYLQTNLSPANICRAYEFAKFHEEQDLMTKSIQIISEKTKEVLEHRSFLDAELDTIKTIFSLNKLMIDSELDLFNAAQSYLDAQIAVLTGWKMASMIEKSPNKINEPATLSKAANGENKSDTSDKAEPTKSRELAKLTPTRPLAASPQGTVAEDQAGHIESAMRSVIEKIRFLTLTPQQFAQGPARSRFLTESEAYAIFMNMLTTWTVVPMPQGFSTSKVMRK